MNNMKIFTRPSPSLSYKKRALFWLRLNAFMRDAIIYCLFVFFALSCITRIATTKEAQFLQYTRVALSVSLLRSENEQRENHIGTYVRRYNNDVMKAQWYRSWPIIGKIMFSSKIDDLRLINTIY